MTELPDPLTPFDCDLQGLEYMPLLGTRLFGSEFNARASDAEWRAAITLWWAAWTQRPAASLPDDDVSLCRLADLGRDLKAWKKVKSGALSGFVRCSDGRLYHPTLAEQAVIAWEKRQQNRTDRSSSAERKAREREARSQMFEQLASVGVTPEWNIKTSDLRSLVTENCHTKPRDSTPPVTADVTAKTGRDGTIPPSPHDNSSAGPFASVSPQVRKVLEAGLFVSVPPDTNLIADWLALPNMELERDIIPMVERMASECMATKGAPPFRLKFFDGRIRERHAQDEREIERLRAVQRRYGSDQPGVSQ